MKAFSSKDAQGLLFPLVSKVLSFVVLLLFSINNSPLFAAPQTGGSPFEVILNDGGGVTGVIVDASCVEMSNNPASDGVFGITCVEAEAFVANITVTDFNGNVVLSQNYHEASVKFDVSNLAVGSYIMTVETTTCTVRMTLTTY